MESGTDLVRLLGDVDKVLERKRKELAELDDRLEIAREKVSQKEAIEIQEEEKDSTELGAEKMVVQDEDIRNYIAEQKKIYEKELADFAEQLSALESMNQQLRDQNQLLSSKSRLAEADDEHYKSTILKLQEKHETTEEENSNLRLALARADAVLKEQQRQLDKSNLLDKVLIEVYQNKIKSLERTIEMKEEEIEHLRADDNFTLESLGLTAAQIDSIENNKEFDDDTIDIDKRQRVIQIAAAMREKDSQIDSLKSRLAEATKELEKSASLLESVTNQQKRTRNADSENQLSLTQQLGSMTDRCDTLERELIYKDERVSDLEHRVAYLECIMPISITEILEELPRLINTSSHVPVDIIMTLSERLKDFHNNVSIAQDMLKENDLLKNSIRSKDSKIVQLVSDLNRMHKQFDLAVRGIKSASAQEEEIDKASHSSTSNEDDFKSVENRDEKSVGCSQQLDALMADNEREENHPSDQVDEQNVNHIEPNSSPKSCVNHLGETNIDNLFSIQKRLRQLEQENELLELAMKEILLCIRWSDSQLNTLIIDCPSLERLCQIIEARYVAESSRLSSCADGHGENSSRTQNFTSCDTNKISSADIYRFVVLKGELDLVRGQNSQLITEIKLLRREHQELLNNTANASALPPVEVSHMGSDSNPKPAIDDNNQLQSETCLKQVEDLQPDVEAAEDTNPRSRVACEAESQTELTLDSVTTLVERVQSPPGNLGVRYCHGCDRSLKMINHLIKSIARLETQVTNSDDKYMLRFKNWNQLMNLIIADLSETTNSSQELRRQCHILSQQKYKAEAKLEIMERHVMNHSKRCPELISQYDAPQSVKNLRIIDSIDRSRSVETPTMRGSKRYYSEVTTPGIRVTIALLKSMIDCLQAQSFCKDEHIRQLESLMSKIQFCSMSASPA